MLSDRDLWAGGQTWAPQEAQPCAEANALVTSLVRACIPWLQLGGELPDSRCAHVFCQALAQFCQFAAFAGPAATRSQRDCLPCRQGWSALQALRALNRLAQHSPDSRQLMLGVTAADTGLVVALLHSLQSLSRLSLVPHRQHWEVQQQLPAPNSPPWDLLQAIVALLCSLTSGSTVACSQAGPALPAAGCAGAFLTVRAMCGVCSWETARAWARFWGWRATCTAGPVSQGTSPCSCCWCSAWACWSMQQSRLAQTRSMP